MIILRNLLTQHADLLNGKLVYIHTDKKNSNMLYQDLIDGGIYYFYNKNIPIQNLGECDLVRLTSKNKEFFRFDKTIKTIRFIQSFKQSFHKYDLNNVFAFKHEKFVVINYDFLLRKKKIDKLLDIIKKSYK